MDVTILVTKECQRRGYSDKTIKTYNFFLKQFFKKYNYLEPKQITKQHIQEYLDYLVDKNESKSTINVTLASLKFFYGEILHKKLLVKIKYSKREKKMPTFLTKEEIVELLSTIKNHKHQLILELLYSAGLRVSEVAKLKVNNLEFSSNIGWVRLGKGKKDRPFIIAEKIIFRLKQYIVDECLDSNSWLFQGQKKGRHISTKTIFEIVKQTTKKSTILKNVHPHTLRHSFATHLIQNNYPVAKVQNLLGHSNVNTTMGYVHMAQSVSLDVISPLDEL